MGPEETWAIVDLIQKLNREEGLTILFTEHDMDVVFDIADQLSVLNMGRIICEGLPEEVQKDERVRECYLGSTWSVDGSSV
jgi:branched-chain amino acid transport system ATP-binding protein